MNVTAGVVTLRTGLAPPLERHDSVLSRATSRAWHDKAVELWDSDDVLDWLQHAHLTSLAAQVQGTLLTTLRCIIMPFLKCTCISQDWRVLLGLKFDGAELLNLDEAALSRT